jgi:hypothetical protein
MACARRGLLCLLTSATAIVVAGAYSGFLVVVAFLPRLVSIK